MPWILESVYYSCGYANAIFTTEYTGFIPLLHMVIKLLVNSSSQEVESQCRELLHLGQSRGMPQGHGETIHSHQP